LALSGLSFVLLIYPFSTGRLRSGATSKSALQQPSWPADFPRELLGREIFGIAIFLLGTTVMLAVVSIVVISFGAAQYQAEVRFPGGGNDRYSG